LKSEGTDGRDPLVALFDEAEPRATKRGELLHAAGEPLSHLHLIVRGWVGRSRAAASGDTAFTGIHLAGDIPCLDGVVRDRVADDLFMLNDGVVRRISVEPVREAAARDPAVAGALTRVLAMETAFLREGLFAVARLSTSERLATFMLQTFGRLVATGLIAPEQRRFAMPLTQSQLAAVTGVTPVHLNRVVQRLRREECLELGGGFASIRDMAALKAEAQGATEAKAGTRTAA
jgi:CRP-like cAMP-binding protein